jgi:secondary thiamine-phosphate synthase enzyme
MIKELSLLSDSQYQLINITEQVITFVRSNNVKDGLVVIFTPHSTAAILLTENENYLKRDWLKFLQILAEGNWEHNKIDNNAEAHLLSGLVGQSCVILIQNGHLVLGSWQSIFFLELDGPRKRNIILKILKSV